jgi:hypothetical protein
LEFQPQPRNRFLGSRSELARLKQAQEKKKAEILVAKSQTGKNEVI